MNAALSLLGLQITQSTHKVAYVVQSPSDKQIAKVCYNATYVGNPGTVTIELRQLDASGNPTGSVLASESMSLNSAGWQSLTFDPTVSIGAGQYFGIVIVPSANLTLTFASVNPSCCAEEFPYCDLYISSWTKSNCPVCALEYTDGTYEVIQGAWPIKTVANTTVTSSDQRGLRFKVPFQTRAVGAWTWADLDGDCTLKLYSESKLTDPALAETETLDKDFHVGTTYGRLVYNFKAPVTLHPNVEYYLVLAPSANITLSEVEVNSAAVMGAMDGGQEFHLASRSGSSGAFTMTATKRPMMGLILDQFSDENLGYFDVTAFGAVGDGAADDTSEITAAFNAANSAGAGSTVFFPQGTYLVDGLTFSYSNLRITGDGTLKLKGASAASHVLTVSGSYNEISGFRIDGNAGGSPTTGNGLLLSGNYNTARDLYISNTKVAATTADYEVTGQHNLLERTWSENAGGIAYKEAGDFNQYRGINAKDWGEAAFKRTANTSTKTRTDIDGFYFEVGLASKDNTCVLFDGASGTTKMVVLRNGVVDWPTTMGISGTPVLARFGRIDWLVLDNCMFRHEQLGLSTLQIDAAVKRASIDHAFLTRQLKLNSIDLDAVIMLVDTQIGDDQLWAGANSQPPVSVAGIAGAQFIARACKFVGYSDAALEVTTNIAGNPYFVHFEASDSDFQGRHATNSTYDVKVSGFGAVNASRKLLWLNNRRSNSGGGPAQTITTVNARVLFTTRDWSKSVFEDSAAPPTGGGITWLPGDTVMHTSPTSGGSIGWVYALAGVPDWHAFGPIT